MEYWPHPACLPTKVLVESCQFERTRRGGPGGQHRNKVESAIVVQHKPSGVSGQASERRSQHANREVALQRLRLNLAIQLRTKVEPDSEPSDLWNKRLSGNRIVVGVRHEDFPSIIAEAMDWLGYFNFQLAETAKRLKCSTSQLIKLIKSNDLVLTSVNRRRRESQQGPLK
jgi:hypothetical protein